MDRINKEKYPDKLLRGISSKSFIQEGILLEEAFKLDPVRPDGYQEISITWYESEEAINTLMTQISDRRSEIQFQGGAAEIDRVELRTKMKPQFLNQNVSYEKSPSITNKFHGNLLVKNSLSKQMKKMIKCQFALLANSTIYRNPNVE